MEPESDHKQGDERQPGVCPQTGLSVPECTCPACSARRLRDAGHGHLLDAFELTEHARRGGELPR